jgi:hypothetical protein
MEPRTGLGIAGQETFGTSIAFLYAREHVGQADLDATVACISSRRTIIARIRIQGRRIGVEEALDSAEWKARLGRGGQLGSAPKYERPPGSTMSSSGPE